jgi:hypothetical protein
MGFRKLAALATFTLCALHAKGEAALFVEEPYGHFGGLTPTGHAAVYLPRVCAETPVKLRMCGPGETGIVISRYHRVGGYDWMAIPLIPYLYAVDNPEDVPLKVNAEMVASLRDNYRRAHFPDIIPDGKDGSMPEGDWTQLVGSSYDRKIYSFEIETSEAQDRQLVEILNTRVNKTHFNLLLYNCADFARFLIDFYYPHAVHRGIFNDLGIMTPKQAARTLAKYSRRHRDLEFTSLEIPQVPGMQRSTPLRDVVEAFVKSKKYVVPVAALHPLFVGGVAVVYATEAIFGDRSPRVKDPPVKPEEIAARLEVGTSSRP